MLSFGLFLGFILCFLYINIYYGKIFFNERKYFNDIYYCKIRFFVFINSRNRTYKGMFKVVRIGELLYKILMLNRENSLGMGRARRVKISRFKYRIY